MKKTKYREFKFRAWDSYHQEMIDWSQYKDELVSEDFINNGKGPLAVMQYTGLKDKNGVEIYEGDILQKENANEKLKLIYCECCCQWLLIGEDDGVFQFYKCDKSQLESIGNIYENEELLGVWLGDTNEKNN